MPNKSTLTNILSLVLIVLGYISPFWSQQILTTGLYAFSGAITNWLAIHMLFEKVPFLYGSGVIPARFEDFKLGIKDLIMQQFFTPENIERFFSDVDSSALKNVDMEPILSVIPFNTLFDKLMAAVNESSLGGILQMFGGAKALEPVREPFTHKIHDAVREILGSQEFIEQVEKTLALSVNSQSTVIKIESLVKKRLDELTPKMVKDIISNMIHAHLGWLVVWGGVFGGLIGLIASFLT